MQIKYGPHYLEASTTHKLQRKSRIALRSQLKEHEMNWSCWGPFFFYITMTNAGEMGREEGVSERERERERDTWRQTEKGRSARKNKLCEKKTKNTSAQFVLDSKLWAERRNKIRDLAGNHVKPCKWTRPQRRVFPLPLMMDLIASISAQDITFISGLLLLLYGLVHHTERVSRGRPLLKWRLKIMRAIYKSNDGGEERKKRKSIIYIWKMRAFYKQVRRSRMVWTVCR